VSNQNREDDQEKRHCVLFTFRNISVLGKETIPIYTSMSIQRENKNYSFKIIIHLFLCYFLRQGLPVLFLPKKHCPIHMPPYHVNQIPSTVPYVHAQDTSICRQLCIGCGYHHRLLYKRNHCSKERYGRRSAASGSHQNKTKIRIHLYANQSLRSIHLQTIDQDSCRFSFTHKSCK
jgi:hypothetical protein